MTNEDTKRRRHLHFSTGETLSLFRPLKPRKKSSLPSVASPDCPLTRREGQSLRPPIFQKPFPVWRGFRARQGDQGAIRAGMPLERRRQFRTNFGRVAGRFPDSRSGQILGDFAPERRANVSCAQDREDSAGRRREAVTRNEMIAKRCLRCKELGTGREGKGSHAVNETCLLPAVYASGSYRDSL